MQLIVFTTKMSGPFFFRSKWINFWIDTSETDPLSARGKITTKGRCLTLIDSSQWSSYFEGVRGV